jgi:hypothetical protein
MIALNHVRVAEERCPADLQPARVPLDQGRLGCAGGGGQPFIDQRARNLGERPDDADTAPSA